MTTLKFRDIMKITYLPLSIDWKENSDRNSLVENLFNNKPALSFAV